MLPDSLKDTPDGEISKINQYYSDRAKQRQADYDYLYGSNSPLTVQSTVCDDFKVRRSNLTDSAKELPPPPRPVLGMC